MSCKYKKFQNPERPWCWVTGGECQFLNSPWDDMCPILHAYPNVPMDVKEYNKIDINEDVQTEVLNLLTS